VNAPPFFKVSGSFQFGSTALSAYPSGIGVRPWRALCCATHLKDFEPVTIKMAKEQNLPLNPTKISGLCGRLMCCLGYEYSTYKDLMKGMPREGEIIKTPKGNGKVVSINALRRAFTVELEDGTQVEIPYAK
jgi:cell fate regulator YaaT (PSP1 superfamily)